MKFRPKQCPICEKRMRNEKYDLANDENYKGVFVCFSDSKERLVCKKVTAKRNCYFFEKEKRLVALQKEKP